MKKISSLLLLLFCLIICQCSLSPRLRPLSPDTLSLKTKANTNSSFDVTEQDLNSYLKYLSVHEKYKSNNVKSVTPLFYNGSLVYYVINLTNGWRIISADKRGPIVLAKSDVGQYEEEFYCDVVQSWFESISKQILYRKEHSDEYYLKLSEQAVSNETKCLNFWRAINADSSFLDGHIKKQSLPQGIRSWFLSDVYEEVVAFESLDHIIPVYWHQGAPFNLYCPLKSYGDTARCPAGCAAVAVAQTLYYFHYNILYRPNSSPSYGSCTGWAGNYTQTFSNPASYTWANMSYSSDPNGYAALLIGYLGKKMHLNYSPTGTGTNSFYDIHSILGSDYGLNYRAENYQMDSVFVDLQSRLPVICIGETTPIGSNPPTAHAFVLDGYESCEVLTHYVYSDGTGNTFEHIVASNPFVTDFRINWGMGTIGRNSTYAATGSWMGYDNNKKIIYKIKTENK